MTNNTTILNAACDLRDTFEKTSTLALLKKIEELEKRLENAENELKAIKYEQTWGEINQTAYFYANREEH